MKKIFGVHIGVFYSYFYVGSVLCLIFCALIAKEVLKTRFILYLFVPVLIGRTFPLGCFYLLGRDALRVRVARGMVYYKVFKNDKPHWLLGGRYCERLGVFNKY